MATATRTDIHRPSSPEFDPEAYDLVGVYDLTPEWGDDGRMDAINDLLTRGYRFAGSTTGGCGHCGANIRYAALMTHSNGRDMLYVGETCLTNRFLDMTKAEFARLRKSAALHRERVAKTDRITALVDEYPLLADLTYPEIVNESTGFISDISWKFCQRGELTERQIEAVCDALLHEIKCREWDAQRAAEDAKAAPVPTGRQVIEGEVLTVKWQDSQYGGNLKMLVKHATGWKVWGTVPSSIDPSKGDRVRFTATISPSGDDPVFGFYSRPTKATVL